MNTIVSRPVSRAHATTPYAMAARLYARGKFALRRFAAIYAQARIRQARIEIQRFEERYRARSDGADDPRSRLRR